MCIVISHRGYHVDMPEYENTSHAMLRAISLGIRRLEFDVRMTADHQLILFHDDHIMIGGTKYPVATKTYDEISHTNPTTERLCEFLQTILSATTPDMGLTFVVDVKTNHRDQGFVDSLVHTLREVEMTFSNVSFVITSFDHRFIDSVQQTIYTQGLSWECGILVYHVPTISELRTYPYEWIGFANDTLTEPVVADVHAVGKKAFVYTPNDTDEYDRCVAMGVDGVYTDDVKLWNDHMCARN
jgi:glycerophosphoryl diester phosphodiesterase